jgi:hypothetical protein
MTYDVLDRLLLARSDQPPRPPAVVPATVALAAGLSAVTLALSGAGEDSDFAVAAMILLAVAALGALYVAVRRLTAPAPSWINPDQLEPPLRNELLATLKAMRDLHGLQGEASAGALAATRPLQEIFTTMATAAADTDETVRRSVAGSQDLQEAAAARVGVMASLLADLTDRLHAITADLRALDELAARSRADEELARRLGTPLPALDVLDAPAERIRALHEAVAAAQALSRRTLDP